MGFLAWMNGLFKDSRSAESLKGLDFSTTPPAIVLDDAGVGLMLDPPNLDSVSSFLAWSEVERVTAFKPELLTSELTCLRLDAVGKEPLELTDRMAGWEELLDTLPLRLPGCLPKQSILLSVTIPGATLGDLVAFERSGSSR